MMDDSLERLQPEKEAVHRRARKATNLQPSPSAGNCITTRDVPAPALEKLGVCFIDQGVVSNSTAAEQRYKNHAACLSMNFETARRCFGWGTRPASHP
jgi:hypothetical protein